MSDERQELKDKLLSVYHDAEDPHSYWLKSLACAAHDAIVDLELKAQLAAVPDPEVMANWIAQAGKSALCDVCPDINLMRLYDILYASTLRALNTPPESAESKAYVESLRTAVPEAEVTEAKIKAGMKVLDVWIEGEEDCRRAAFHTYKAMQEARDE